MENINFEGVNLAELLPRIPESVKNGLPFGIVKMDLTGKILAYNMAEGELNGVNPNWAIGKNFFDDVALCTKTQAFYGRFVEGVKKGFLNVVFEYVFDHLQEATKVKIHMFTMPDGSGKKTVMLLIKRASKPLIIDAISQHLKAGDSTIHSTVSPAHHGAPAVQEVVNAVIAAMNETVPASFANSAHPVRAFKPATSGGARHQDIFKF